MRAAEVAEARAVELRYPPEAAASIEAPARARSTLAAALATSAGGVGVGVGAGLGLRADFVLSETARLQASAEALNSGSSVASDIDVPNKLRTR